MAVAIELIQPGAVFRFKTAARRVTSLSEPLGSGFNVRWEYADGKKRGGRSGGSQWVYYFKAEAIEQIPDPAVAGEPHEFTGIPARHLEVVREINTD